MKSKSMAAHRVELGNPPRLSEPGPGPCGVNNNHGLYFCTRAEARQRHKRIVLQQSEHDDAVSRCLF